MRRRIAAATCGYVGYPNVNDTVGWTAEGDAAEYWIEPYIHPEPERLLSPDDTEGHDTVAIEYRGISFTPAVR